MIYEVMSTRRSVRTFRPDLPDRTVIESLLEAAIRAPSAGNRQPWRFWVVTNRESIDLMAAAVRDAVEGLSHRMPQAAADSFRAYARGFTLFEAAPVVILPLCRPPHTLADLAGDALPDRDTQRLRTLEDRSALIGASLAVQNLLLMAHAQGLGAVVMTGPLLASDRIRVILSLPPSWELVAVVPVGFPDEDPATTPRKPVSQVTRWIE